MQHAPTHPRIHTHTHTHTHTLYMRSKFALDDLEQFCILVGRSEGAIKAPLRRYSGDIEDDLSTIFAYSSGAMKALLRLYYGTITELEDD
jgi:hypothetical protein